VKRGNVVQLHFHRRKPYCAFPSRLSVYLTDL
jgi:hypothetical protein